MTQFHDISMDIDTISHVKALVAPSFQVPANLSNSKKSLMYYSPKRCPYKSFIIFLPKW